MNTNLKLIEGKTKVLCVKDLATSFVEVFRAEDLATKFCGKFVFVPKGIIVFS